MKTTLLAVGVALTTVVAGAVPALSAQSAATDGSGAASRAETDPSPSPEPKDKEKDKEKGKDKSKEASPTPSPTVSESPAPAGDESGCRDVVGALATYVRPITFPAAAHPVTGSGEPITAATDFAVLLAEPSCPETTYTFTFWRPDPDGAVHQIGEVVKRGGQIEHRVDSSGQVRPAISVQRVFADYAERCVGVSVSTSTDDGVVHDYAPDLHEGRLVYGSVCDVVGGGSGGQVWK